MRTLPGDTLESGIDMQDENQSVLSISDDMASLYEEDMLHTEEDWRQKTFQVTKRKLYTSWKC